MPYYTAFEGVQVKSNWKNIQMENVSEISIGVEQISIGVENEQSS